MEFDYFNNIENKDLRVWNRTATVFNIMSLHGSKSLAKYLSKLTEDERTEVSEMFKRVREEGYENVRRDINRRTQALAA